MYFTIHTDLNFIYLVALVNFPSVVLEDLYPGALVVVILEV
jgi:hypothetical protein